MSNFLRSIPITSDMVSLWVPSGTNRAIDIIRGNHGQCDGIHPNVPVIRKDSALGSLVYDGLSGTFTVGDDINGGTSGAHAIVKSDDGSTLGLTNCSGLFNNNEQITGVSSSATADVNQPDGAVGVDKLVKNGAFVDDNDPPADWTAGASAVLTTEGSGQADGNCMMVTNGAALYGRASLAITLGIGKVYKFTAYFKKGTSATAHIYLGTSAGGSQIWDSGSLSDAGWTKYTHTFTSTVTTAYISCVNKNVDTETSYFDEISLYEIDRYQLINPSVGWVFDGTNDYVDMGTSVGDYTDNFTLGCWLFGGSGVAGTYLFSRRKTTLQYSVYVHGTTGMVNFHCTAGGFSALTDIRDSKWHFCSVVINGASSYVYLDGSIDSNAGNPTVASRTERFEIGSWNSGGTGNFDGYIALPFIANKAWSAAQVKNFYNATKGMFSPRG